MAFPAFEQKYIATGQVRLVYHEYPLSGHANAVPASEAARCADDQGQFWQMHDLIFANQRQWSSLGNPSAQFAAYASSLGLDTSAFAACLSGGTHRQAILQARASGDALQLPGTPSFAVNGKLVNTTGAQSVDDIVARVEAEIAAALAGS